MDTQAQTQITNNRHNSQIGEQDHNYDVFISYSHQANKAIASLVQNGLQRLAKPWYKRSSVKIFRDESNLSATPELWSEIAKAIDTSSAFVLVASPESAASAWVKREVAHWFRSHSFEQFFIVVVDGNIEWNHGNRDFDWSITNCLSPELERKYTEEPLFIDLRFLKNAPSYKLKSPQLRASLARLVAPIRGVPLDTLISEDLRLHRQVLKVAWSAVTTLILLSFIAVFFGITAIKANKKAQQEALNANARTLALQSIVSDQVEQSSDLAILLALESIRLQPNISGYRSLLLALNALSNLESYLWVSDYVYTVSFSNNGNSLFALTEDEKVLAWDLRSKLYGQAPINLKFEKQEQIVVSPSRMDMLTSFEGEHISIDRQTNSIAQVKSNGVEIFKMDGKKQQIASKNTDDITSIALSQGAEFLATGNRNGMVTVQNVKGGKVPHLNLFPGLASDNGDYGMVTALALSTSAQRLAAAYEDQSLWIWNIENGNKKIILIDTVFSEINRLVFDSSGGAIYAAFGNQVRRWDLENGSSQSFIGAKQVIFDIALSPDERRLAGASKGLVLLWHLDSQGALSRKLVGDHNASVIAVAIDPEETTAYSLDYNGWLISRNFKSQSLDYDLTLIPTTAGRHAVFRNYGHNLLTLEDSGMVLTHWQINSTNPRKIFHEALPAQGTALAVSSNGGWVSVILDNSSISIYRIEADKIVFHSNHKTSEDIFTAALSENGEWLAAAYLSDGFFILNLQNGKKTIVRKGHKGMVTGFAFNPSATLLVTAGMDQFVGRWRIPDLTSQGHMIKAHTGVGHTIVAINPKTEQLVSSGSDANIFLWPQAKELQEPLPLIEHVRPAYALSFTSDGRYLLAGDGDKEVILWELNPDKWREKACEMVNRKITAAEWRLYIQGSYDHNAVQSGACP